MVLLNKSWALSALFALVRQKGGSHPIVLQAIALLPQLLYVLELAGNLFIYLPYLCTSENCWLNQWDGKPQLPKT